MWVRISTVICSTIVRSKWCSKLVLVGTLGFKGFHPKSLVLILLLDFGADNDKWSRKLLFTVKNKRKTKISFYNWNWNWNVISFFYSKYFSKSCWRGAYWPGTVLGSAWLKEIILSIEIVWMTVGVSQLLICRCISLIDLFTSYPRHLLIKQLHHCHSI